MGPALPARAAGLCLGAALTCGLLVLRLACAEATAFAQADDPAANVHLVAGLQHANPVVRVRQEPAARHALHLLGGCPVAVLPWAGTPCLAPLGSHCPGGGPCHAMQDWALLDLVSVAEGGPRTEQRRSAVFADETGAGVMRWSAPGGGGGGVGPAPTHTPPPPAPPGPATAK